MIKTIEVQNYKSIDKLSMSLGRVNVFIGENGAGKSNILEAIALAGAASAEKLDNEFLTSRGIRVTNASLMRPAFDNFSDSDPIQVTVTGELEEQLKFSLQNDNSPYSQWRCEITGKARSAKFSAQQFSNILKNLDATEGGEDLTRVLREAIDKMLSKKDVTPESLSFSISVDDAESADHFFSKTPVTSSGTSSSLKDFIVYSPENSALRTFEKEGQIEPLGVNGEGTLKLLKVLSANAPEVLREIKTSLAVLGWFKDFDLVDEGGAPSRMEIKDRFLAEGKSYYDQRSANEGFLFLVFYFALFSSSLTPAFFAVDNIDASLNPKLCQRLVQQLVKLAQAHDKQVILTTHNPAVLDGLNLDDEDQRLFAISRNTIGFTRIKRITKSKNAPGIAPEKLSEAFLRGSIGGLPRGF